MLGQVLQDQTHHFENVYKNMGSKRIKFLGESLNEKNYKKTVLSFFNSNQTLKPYLYRAEDINYCCPQKPQEIWTKEKIIEKTRLELEKLPNQKNYDKSMGHLASLVFDLGDGGVSHDTAKKLTADAMENLTIDKLC